MSFYRTRPYWGLLLTMILGCGKQPNAYVVHGMVVFPDGSPLRKGTVEFEAIGQTKPITASGEIASDGTFQLGTFQAKDGAVSGQHRVAIIADYEIGTGVERPGELPAPQLHPKFRSFKTSGLTFNVKPQMNNLLIEVEYATP
ncbi:MAG: hypothetical protein NT013_24880 [Planctomycetia bacterium]|nr:hypothetical protein [Planctomycetia bacterium]